MGKSLVHWRRQGRRLGIAVLFVIVGTGLWEFQGRQHQDAYTWQGVPIRLPVIRIEEADIWGLSLRMLDDFFMAIGLDEPC